jgi:hypothetical protein
LGGLCVAGKAQKSASDDVDFSGWQSFGLGIWTADGGEIIGRCNKTNSGPGYLFTRQVYTDFRMTVLFLISGGGKSGVYVREPLRKWSLDGDSRPGAGPSGGYEVLIDYRNPENPTGTIDNIQKPKKLAGAEEKWNEMEIVCRGAEIRVSVAGQTVNRFNQMRVQPGVIGFEVPGTADKDFVVRFRDIKISSIT